MQWKSVGKYIQSKKNTVLCAALAGMMLMSSGFTMNGLPKNMHRVSVHVDGETINDMTVQTQPNDIFAKLGVTLGEKDTYEVQESKDPPRTDISVRRAVPVTISFWGDTQQVMTSGHTVGDVVAEYGYNMNEVDVNPGVDTPVTANLAIQLTENEQAAEQRRAREREAERVSRGIPRYRAAYTMHASAYLPSDGGGSGITATGMAARRGVVAVDPNVIPLGSRLYIPGYGEAIAADTGGAIVGNTIDLCMESYDEAIQFGRRSVEVYVLE
ncbi:G5 and 3D domain-containing protein [Selenomonas flueggei]|uniref:G5 and 3D domain-containing protein n=1 Tax=Selenomonas flueggei TaxID=135080 RepID=UPI0026730CD7|nr:3D domain-containing protein [Selenomonas flueggei]